MRRFAFIAAIAALVLGVAILLFAGGLRRWYSGLFFLLLGLVGLISALKRGTAGANG